MIDLAKELLGSYTIHNKNTESMEVELQPSPSWTYFAGHFPQAPILPAVAMIDISLFFIEELRALRTSLREVADFKIKNPVTPSLKVLIKIQKERSTQENPLEANYIVSWAQYDSGKVLGDIRLRFIEQPKITQECTL